MSGYIDTICFKVYILILNKNLRSILSAYVLREINFVLVRLFYKVINNLLIFFYFHCESACALTYIVLLK